VSSSQSKHVIVGTAGHIDHGKTALVQALTGVDTDRWAEEKRRGITIDLGFARLDLADDLRLGFVDVPGHERFVKNMLAGAAGIDLALFVVAADESIMPQTREHFDICGLLGVRAGVVALTKADLADADMLGLVRMEVEELVQSSFLDGAPIVPVSSKTGAGLDELRAALAETARHVESKSARRRFRLPIDRVFVIQGFGAVATGTLVAGNVKIGAELEVLPGGERYRVRGLETHDQQVESARAGQRTAVNLGGADAADLSRGMVLTEPGVVEPSLRVECELSLLPHAAPLKHGAPIHLHIGSAEFEGRVFFASGADERSAKLQPGERSWARLQLSEPVVALADDRFVIRRFSPVETIGGGRVLDPHPPQRSTPAQRDRRLEAFASSEADRILEALAYEAPFGVVLRDLTVRTGVQNKEAESAAKKLVGAGTAIRLGPRIVHRERVEQAAAKLLEALGEFHRKNPLLPGMPARTLASSVFDGSPEGFCDNLLTRLAANGAVAAEAERVRLASHRIRLQDDEREARDRIVSAFEEAGLQVPALKEFLPGLKVDAARARKILANLLREGLLVKVTDQLVFHRQALAAMDKLLAERKAQNPRISVGEFKDLAGVSRKWAIPLLEYLDRSNKTRRDGAERVIR